MQSLKDRNHRILVIDDNPAIHEDFRKILVSDSSVDELSECEAAFFGDDAQADVQPDFELGFAHQGQEGLEMVLAAIADERPYAMAFVDMRMPPGWGGLKTIEHLWQVDPDLQVVICTAYSDNSWSDICQRLGQTDGLLVLKKPFDIAEVSQLASALTEKWTLTKQARLKQQDLEELVEQRTTELREQAAALQQKQKMEAVGSLAGGIAHEFNNLLQVIQGYTGFAQQGLAEDDQRFQDLAEVLKAADRAASLTSQLLCFSRTDQSETRVIPIAPMLEDLARLLKPVIGEHIALTIEPADDCRVMADPSGLQQALLNLFVNARDAMPAGGDLVLATRTETLSAADCQRHGLNSPGPYVCFSLTDTGEGMSTDQIDRIFEPFFTTKEVGKGTGLGLAMVHGFVERHHGLIKVESEVGRGTTFRVYLPVVDEPTVEESDADDGVAIGGVETLLIAEDEPMVRRVAQRILTDAGYQVLCAENGQQAVELFAQHQADIALTLLDVVMPKMTGREAYELIREMDPCAHVVFCTGYDPETSHAASFDQEDLTLVQKPYDPPHLLRTIRNVLDGCTQVKETACMV